MCCIPSRGILECIGAKRHFPGTSSSSRSLVFLTLMSSLCSMHNSTTFTGAFRMHSLNPG
ncbi:hypothetical protein ARMSODRAFT_209344 [Armillaria solidipes]|uniref:Uncharacterized protein n=1 Tax=Armillaria solidipes TaxID=1076256 RepID=A0A2H3BBE7_9AGAR|nr:hypothetical protein ARMSODRAFT_209344 [Armillaria solidipes]